MRMMTPADVDRLHAHFIKADPAYREAIAQLEDSQSRLNLEPHVVKNVKSAQIKYARHRAGLALPADLGGDMKPPRR